MTPKSSTRRDELYLIDIVKSARSIAYFLKDVEEERWLGDEQLQSAVQWKIMNIGEAASGISEATRAMRPEIPWRKIRGLRNILAHAYFSVDLSAIWKTSRTDVPIMEKQALDLLWLVNPDSAQQLKIEDASTGE
ncbi:HepT-like ribonuclease domain-containing protein [Streptosporangium sp. NPDC020072]|uniref:HepT-like ribonuclease domain-containing protein n=1 Tax=Streptosporangium sp. NPDC020072 TaxID=3154788 RepID=UPI0034364D28